MKRTTLPGILVMLATTNFANAATSSCLAAQPSVMSFPITNVRTSTGPVYRGVQFQYGTPAQNFSFAVTNYYNETYIWDSESNCDTTTLQCAAMVGGLFSASSSSTRTHSGNVIGLSSPDNPSVIGDTHAVYSQDTVVIDGRIRIDNFTTITPRAQDSSPLFYNTLGLGSQSRLLDAVVQAGYSTVRAWSLFWGQTGMTNDHTADGALLLGGIDTTQTTGANYTGRIQNSGACTSGMVVDVTDIVVSFPNGTSGSIMPSQANGQSQNYCLLPESGTTTMFRAVYDKWARMDPGARLSYDGDSPERVPNGWNGWGLRFPKSRPPQGDLTITINDDFKIHIPNHQLVQPYLNYQSDGSVVVNDTYIAMPINPLQGPDASLMPRLAATFFQAAYLHVNYDQQTFTLWQAANPMGQNSKYVRVGQSNNICPNTNGTTGGNGGGSGSSSSSDSTSKASISGGAIAGIVVGALALLAGLAILLLFIRRRKRRQHPRIPEMQGSNYGGRHLDGSTQYFVGGKPELDSRGYDTSTTRQNYKPAMVPHELPTDGYGSRTY